MSLKKPIILAGLMAATFALSACHPGHYARHGHGPYARGAGVNQDANQARRDRRQENRGVRADCRDGIQSACDELDARRSARQTRARY